MSIGIPAIYEKGVLRPLAPLALRDQEKVTIQLIREIDDRQDGDEDWLDTEIAAIYAADADDSITLEQVRQDLSTIEGSLDSAIEEARGEY